LRLFESEISRITYFLERVPYVTAKEKDDRDPVTKRLDAIIRLLMEQEIRVEKVQKGKLLLLLKSSGLSTAEIGLIDGGRAGKDVASTLRKVTKN
jgi:hypothetical protein